MWTLDAMRVDFQLQISQEREDTMIDEMTQNIDENQGILDIQIQHQDLREHRGTLEPTPTNINQIEMFNQMNTPGNLN